MFEHFQSIGKATQSVVDRLRPSADVIYLRSRRRINDCPTLDKYYVECFSNIVANAKRLNHGYGEDAAIQVLQTTIATIKIMNKP